MTNAHQTPTIKETIAALASPIPPADPQIRWHIERSIPISVIIAIFVQTIFGVWWLASLTFEVRESSNRLTKIEESRITSELRAEPLLERFYKVETEVQGLRQKIESMDSRIERNEEFRRNNQKLNQLSQPPINGGKEVLQ